MIPAKNKPLYKVISLFIKSAILFFSFYYIYDKLKEAPLILDVSMLFSKENRWYTVALLLLMIANWSVEAIKWKRLIEPLEKINFNQSLKGVLAGVTISIFTPNRIGEFAGRVFFLKQSDKIQATIMSLMGSISQLLVTVVAGILAFYILEKKYYDFFQIETFVSVNLLFLILLFIIVLSASAIYLMLKKQPQSEKFKKYFETLKLHSKKSLNTVLNLSILRYIIFSIQYYLALKIFGINGGVMIVFSLIALTFFVTSAIPTFALTEIAVRTGVAIYFFGTISDAHASILAASLFLWMINLAIPSIVGSLFVHKLNFFKEH
ncbi:MAG: flippase-like domain-containing protein [Bacteroidetes bacterium]|nr:flippase-like domain-containing protein [Bacteroidota bacterium]